MQDIAHAGAMFSTWDGIQELLSVCADTLRILRPRLSKAICCIKAIVMRDLIQNESDNLPSLREKPCVDSDNNELSEDPH